MINHTLFCIKMETLVKLDDGAIIPTRAHPTDTGYDLHVISCTIVNGATIAPYYDNHELLARFETGVHIKPPSGYYFDVVPRSSFSKLGFTFANSVGIIDDTYRGSIQLMVRGPFDLLAPYTYDEKKFPLKWFQLVLRKREDCVMTLVDSLDTTERGNGGFGSTG